MRTDGATHCYIGKEKCGCTVAACVDLPQHPNWTAEAVAEFISEGMEVERVPMDDARLRLTGCLCNGQQLTIPIEAQP